MTPQESKEINPKCEEFYKTTINPVLVISPVHEKKRRENQNRCRAKIAKCDLWTLDSLDFDSH